MNRLVRYVILLAFFFSISFVYAKNSGPLSDEQQVTSSQCATCSNQCATWDSASLTLHVPCFNFGGIWLKRPWSPLSLLLIGGTATWLTVI